MSPKEAPSAFIQKIKDRMAAENIGVSQLARKLGVSHPTVIDVVTYGKKPSLDTAVALAKWFNQSEVSILREAGILPPDPDKDPWVEDTAYKISQLPASYRGVVDKFIDSLLEDEESKPVRTKPNHKPAKA